MKIRFKLKLNLYMNGDLTLTLVSDNNFSEALIQLRRLYMRVVPSAMTSPVNHELETTRG